MNILRLVETEFQGETNPGNYMGPDIDAFGIVVNNSDEKTHTPETEAERKKRKKEKQDMETVATDVTESSKDILDELLEDPQIQAMLTRILGGINVEHVHEASIDDIVSALMESSNLPAGSVGPATSSEWAELSTFDAKDVMKAIEVEKEHTTNKGVAAKIALGHFKEDPEYYTKLARVEGEKPYVKTS
jgi:hypothetical protein